MRSGLGLAAEHSALQPSHTRDTTLVPRRDTRAGPFTWRSWEISRARTQGLTVTRRISSPQAGSVEGWPAADGASH